MGIGTLRRAVLPALLALAIGLASALPASAFERLGQYGVGLPGEGNGQLILPTGVGVAPGGTVVASDIGATRVSVFSQDGDFLRAFGKDVSKGGGVGAEVCTVDCKAGAGGTAAGELFGPWGVAVGSSEIYVPELNNNRVSVFNFEGKFLRAFGADVGGPGVNVCTATCSAGTGGAAAGQMSAPAGIALDPSGRLAVGELGTSRVSLFDPKTGKFLLAFGKDVGGVGVHTCTTTCNAGVPDGTPGSISLPYAVSAGPNGDVFVAENGKSRISVFNSAGKFLRTFGGPGEGAGQLNVPYGVAADALGNAYVSDSINQRLAVFPPGGFRAYGLDVIPGGLIAPEVCTNLCKTGVGGFGVGEFVNPYGIATDCRNAVYVGMSGRVDKWGEEGERLPPCPSNDFSLGKLRRNKKKGFVRVEVTVSGPGSLAATVGKKLKSTVPQPAAAGTVLLKVAAAGKGVKTLNRKGKLKTNLSVTFTPPNGDPNTQSRKVTVVKKKRRKKGGKKGGKRRR
jgi:hypothetical protein